MIPSEWLPRLLGIAVLLPLVAFVVNLLVGPALKKYAAYLSTLMICLAFVCSMTALVLAWLPWWDFLWLEPDGLAENESNFDNPDAS